MIFSKFPHFLENISINVIEFPLSVFLIRIVLIDNSIASRSGERILSAPLINHAITVNGRMVHVNGTEIPVHESPSRARFIRLGCIKIEFRIVIADPQMPTPEDISVIVTHGSNCISLDIRQFDVNLLLRRVEVQ